MAEDGERRESQIDAKRIAKNTLMLYVRLLFSLVVSLYASRVVLQVLGVTDFGIFNVVGGVVAMLSMVTGSMSSAIIRFMTFELGKGDKERLRDVFSTSVTIQIILSAIVLLLAESVGLWFIKTQLNIPAERMDAALGVFQFSVFSFVATLVVLPYPAAMVSHERLGIFAVINICENVLRLLIIIMLSHLTCDRLVAYAGLLFGAVALGQMAYWWYCSQQFEECNFRLRVDKSILREMFGFAGWNSLGFATGLCNRQGPTILMNIYYSLDANAARGLAMQVQSACTQLVDNFMSAVRPQITKSFAANDLNGMHRLMCSATKLSALLMLMTSLPLIIETEYILNLWLGAVPEHTVTFVRLTLICLFADTVFSDAFQTAVMATGKIRRYQIVTSAIGLLVFPLTWIAYSMGAPVDTTYFIYIVIYTILIGVRLWFAKSCEVGFPIRMMLRDVVLRFGLVAVVAAGLTVIVTNILAEGTSLRFVTCAVSGVVVTCILSLLFGMNTEEKGMVKEVINRKLKR